MMTLAITGSAYAGTQMTPKSGPVNIGNELSGNRTASRLLNTFTGSNIDLSTPANLYAGVKKAVAEEISVEGTELTMGTLFGGHWWVAFNDGAHSVCLYLMNPEEEGAFAGTYVDDDIYPGYSYVSDLATSTTYRFETVNVITTGDDPQVACEITGSGVLDNGDVVSFHYLKMPPIVPVATVELTGETETYINKSDNHEGDSYITVKTDNKLFTLTYTGAIGSQLKLNTKYSGYEDLSTGEFCKLDHGTATSTVVGYDVEFVADMVCKDSIEYVISFSTPITVAGTKNVEVHNMEVSSFLGLATLFQGSNDEYLSVQGMMVPEPEPGDFSNKMVFGLTDNTGSYVTSLAIASCLLDLDEVGNWVIDAQFIGDDMVDYTVHMDFKIPEITEERDYISTHGIFNDLTESLGILQIYVEGNDRFSVVLDMEELDEGHYNSLSEAYKTFNNIILGYSEGGETLQMFFGEFDLAIDDKNFALTGDCQAGSILFHVNITGPLERIVGNAYDNSTEDLDIAFSAEEITLFEINEDDGYASIRATRADGSATFTTRIYIDGSELPAGVYPLSDSYEPGTAQAGDCNGGSVDPTYYTKLTPEGYAQLPLWLCVDGTVTVSYDVEGVVSVICEATNTWGCSGRFTINEQLVGIENVSAPVAAGDGKFMLDGNVTIRHNGVLYNAFGQMK